MLQQSACTHWYWFVSVAQFSVIEEEDLSHYTNQPDRLIEEYKKLKTAKKKAEQFAIEAKQSAQKVYINHVGL